MSLPADVMLEILSRLPTKSIARFRCVSKSFKSLFMNPVFMKTHLHHSLNSVTPSTLIMYRDPITCKFFSTISSKENPDLEIVNLQNPLFIPSDIKHLLVIGSCNGLLCFHSWYANKIYIWNPSMMEYVILPPFFISGKRHNEIAVLGFGYDNTTDDYKVVKIVHMGEPETWSEVEVYKLSKGCWETISPVPLPSHLVPVGEGGVTVCGAVHWLASNNRITDRVIVFDLGHEVFHEIPLPDLSSLLGKQLHLGSLDGQLAVFSFTLFQCYELWVMKEYGVHQSWVKQHTITQEGLVGNISWPVGFTATGEFLLNNKEGQVISYDPRSEEVKFVVNVDLLCHTRYVENLLSLEGLRS